MVGRREGKLVGYLLATSLAAKAHVAIVQTMLRVFPPPPDCYLYGPVCVAESERGNGLASILYEELRLGLAGRPAMTFIRSDNTPSLRAHRKMGMKELGEFVTEGESYIAFGYQDRAIRATPRPSRRRAKSFREGPRSHRREKRTDYTMQERSREPGSLRFTRVDGYADRRAEMAVRRGRRRCAARGKRGLRTPR